MNEGADSGIGIGVIVGAGLVVTGIVVLVVAGVVAGDLLVSVVNVFDGVVALEQLEKNKLNIAINVKLTFSQWNFFDTIPDLHLCNYH